ncbi:uncharacterized protein LOC126657721 [Mercurialis annua]|uniref:uncharacterized protein LOC126657721 n=1 Tax=Mercurialis annua TaxID=3986 RepID=UPI002160FAC2|nr:uncharacterized protein LOC126657721 [Mercurialis annua]
MASDPARLFVGGLKRETNEKILRDYFAKFGHVKEALIMYDKENGISKSFGFVTFEDSSSAGKTFHEDQHIIHGRKVDVKRAIPKNQLLNNQEQNSTCIQNHGNYRNGSGAEVTCTKIFVGGLPNNTSNEELEIFFKAFGTIIDAISMYNRETGKSRGFGFITFDSKDSLDIVLQNRYHQFKGCQIEVKKATAKIENNNKNCGGIHNFSYFMGPYYILGSTIPYWYLVNLDDAHYPPFMNGACEANSGYCSPIMMNNVMQHTLT